MFNSYQNDKKGSVDTELPLRSIKIAAPIRSFKTKTNT